MPPPYEAPPQKIQADRNLQNLVYFCGPHGSGKDTLAKKVAELDPRILVPELTTRTPPMPDEVPQRQYLKICQRALEEYEYECIARSHLHRIVIGNRCSLDDATYRRAFVSLGWLTKEQSHHISEIQAIFRTPPSLAVVLNPPFEVVVEHLQKRWKESHKKWREDNLEYLRAVCTAYEAYKDKPGILYLYEGNPTTVYSWLQQQYLTSQNKPLPQSLNTPTALNAPCAGNRKELAAS